MCWHGGCLDLCGHRLSIDDHTICVPFEREEERATMWTKPEYTEMRFGFEITMYIENR